MALIRRRGAALIIVLGVMVILAVVSTTFVLVQTIERSVSRNYMDTVRAKMIATAGVEDATQRMRILLQEGVTGPNLRMARYYGQDKYETGDPLLGSAALEQATNPSFAYEDEVVQNPTDSNVVPKTISVNGSSVGLTSFFESGTYGKHGDFYSVAVSDLQGRIYINDGFRQGASGSVSQNLKRILNNLGGQLGAPGLGDLILAKRPAGGYQSVQQLATVLGDSNYGKVRDFLTTHAWVDKNVANPVPLDASVLTEYPVSYYRGTGVYRYGRSKNWKGMQVATPIGFSPPASNNTGNAVYALDELNPQWIEGVERAPVNVNSAPKEVLVALLDGLRGFFLVERRRNNVPGWQSAYTWLGLEDTYDPQGAPGDELGYLYPTVPLVGPDAGTVTSGISAEAVAQHILACREGKATASGVVPPFDYSSVTWSGPFRTWRQFSQFCDNLVTIGLFVDTRPLYFDVASNGSTYPSMIQRKKAAQAIADVLKANFNPNLHLNELNPDANLFTWVDKTDLIVNSTEFCFLPMGYFSIESLGRIVEPVESDDALTAADNRLVAEKKVSAVLKLFDAHRETSQKHFAAGTLSPRKGLPMTNNNKSLEWGPEPDQGTAASENEWDGYLALPTVGGHPINKAPNSMIATPAGPAEMGSVLHGHFAYDFLLHHHADGHRQDLASYTLPGEGVANLPDRTESAPGPYVAGNVYRLARSFRIVPGQSFPPLSYRAPADLRIDGAYSERHSAPAYWLSPNVFGPSIGQSQGVIAFWVKPSYFPEMSGKARMFLSADRQHGPPSVSYINPSPFMLLYTASQDAPAYGASTTEGANPFYNSVPFGVAPFRPMSLGFGYGYSGATGYGSGTIAEGGCLTPTLNHLSHLDGQPSWMQGHQWMHVIVTWRPQNKNDCSVYVNGQLLPGTKRVWYGSYKPDSVLDWTMHHDGSRNSLRLGAVSKFRDTGIWGYDRNWPADATIDELYMWNSLSSYSAASTLWQRGRYYKPLDSDEGIFTSAEINLTAGIRVLPPPSLVAPPLSTGAGPTMATTASVPPKVRLLGVSWTWFGEAGVNGVEVLTDHADGQLLQPEVKVSLLSGATVYGPFSDAGYSVLPGQAEIEGAFRYRVHMSIPDAQFDSILLSSPIFDDITIFYRLPGSEYELFVME